LDPSAPVGVTGGFGGWRKAASVSGGEGVDGVHQLVEIGNGGVDVRGYADAAYILPDDAYGVNFVLVEERTVEFSGRHAVDAYAANGAGVFCVERRVQLYLLRPLHAGGPVVL
jgi:hypothetical protein